MKCKDITSIEISGRELYLFSFLLDCLRDRNDHQTTSYRTMYYLNINNIFPDSQRNEYVYREEIGHSIILCIHEHKLLKDMGLLN